MSDNAYSKQMPAPNGAALSSNRAVGIKGEALANPCQEFRGTRNVPGPKESGSMKEGNPSLVDADIPKRTGRPRSLRKKRKISLSQRAAELIDALPQGVKCYIVSKAILLFFDDGQMKKMMDALPQLNDLSARIQNLLEALSIPNLTAQDAKILHAIAASIIRKINNLIKD